MLKHTSTKGQATEPIGLHQPASGKGRRIQMALEALLNDGAPVSNLSKTELYVRVAQQLKAQGYLPGEIPSSSTLRRHLKDHPIAEHIAAWMASRAQWILGGFSHQYARMRARGSSP